MIPLFIQIKSGIYSDRLAYFYAWKKEQSADDCSSFKKRRYFLLGLRIYRNVKILGSFHMLIISCGTKNV